MFLWLTKIVKSLLHKLKTVYIQTVSTKKKKKVRCRKYMRAGKLKKLHLQRNARAIHFSRSPKQVTFRSPFLCKLNQKARLEFTDCYHKLVQVLLCNRQQRKGLILDFRNLESKSQIVPSKLHCTICWNFSQILRVRIPSSRVWMEQIIKPGCLQYTNTEQLCYVKGLRFMI